jgi:hypothetical protein
MNLSHTERQQRLQRLVDMRLSAVRAMVVSSPVGDNPNSDNWIAGRKLHNAAASVAARYRF